MTRSAAAPVLGVSEGAALVGLDCSALALLLEAGVLLLLLLSSSFTLASVVTAGALLPVPVALVGAAAAVEGNWLA